MNFTKHKQIFNFLKPYFWSFSLGLLILFCSSLMGVFFPILLGKLFGAKNIDQIDWQHFSTNQLHWVFISLLGIFALQAVFSFFRIFLFAKASENALSDLRSQIYHQLIRLPISFYHKNKVGEMTARFSADIALLQETFNTVLAEFIRQIILIIGSLIYLFWVSFSMTLMMLVTLPLMSIVAIFFGRYIRKLGKVTQNKMAETNALLEESLRGILIIKSFSKEVWENLRFKTQSEDLKNLSIKNAIWRGIFVSFIIFAMMGSVLLMIWYGLFLKEKGLMLESDFFSFLFSSIFIGVAVGSLPELYAKIQKALGASERLMEWLNEKPENLQLLVTSEPLNAVLEFKNISFYYESRPEILVLKNISFQVPQGKTVALVGSSGVGKSTLAGLILRLFEPQTGEILLGGKSHTTISLAEWRKDMALVPQEIFLFAGTIAENIAYGNPQATREQIIEAAKQAHILEFTDQFSEGLETLVGDRGVQLSGGQKQRVAIARAILKNPSLLILDEATSALDSESEKSVQQALDTLMQDRTCVVIAHRMSTIRNADQILVLEQGTIAEQGTHQELLERKGLYYQLNN